MKERPILFSGPMVRAILEGRKTQTRRAVKLPESLPPVVGWEPNGSAWKGVGKSPEVEQQFISTWPMSVRCPHGTVGDRLWVREAWAKAGEVSDVTEYRADNHDPNGAKWRPSIHMPRLASRITLEITGVRVERLQEISGEDAKAEGVQPIPFSNGTAKAIWEPGYGACGQDSYTPAFQSLWQSINGPESWSANPWVWVIEFRRVEQC